MDVFRQAYPGVTDVYLSWALDNVDDDVNDAIMLLDNGEPNEGEPSLNEVDT